jgi:hypothetical protein
MPRFNLPLTNTASKNSIYNYSQNNILPNQDKNIDKFPANKNLDSIGNYFIQKSAIFVQN